MSLNNMQVAALYVAVYNRAPDAAGLTYWTTDFTGSYADAAAGFVSHPLFVQDYATLTNQQVVEKFYTNILGSAGDTGGIDYWVARLDAGEDMGLVLSEFLNATLTGNFAGDSAALARQATLINKSEVGVYYASKLGAKTNMDAANYDPATVNVANDPAFIAGQNAIAGVTFDRATVNAAEAAIDKQVPGVKGEDYYLEVTRDVITGTDNDDMFIANIEQNQNGEQVNTLGTGDRLNGGAGVDTLKAQLTVGSFVGGNGGMAVQPMTSNIENIEIQALYSSAENGSGSTVTGQNVYLNAKDMVDVEYIGSERSDANLVIQNLTSEGVGSTADMTIGMKYTGNKDQKWKQSDLKVLFDQDYLTGTPKFTKPIVDINLMNEDAYDETNGQLPLAGVFIRELTITVNGERFELAPYITEDQAGDGEEITTYAELLAAINVALAALKADNAGNAALQSVTAALDGQFFADISPNTGLMREGTSIRLSVDAQTNGSDNSLSVERTDLELGRVTGTKYENNNRFERAENDPAVIVDELVTVNVELEKVGRAGDGGELVIGSMNKGNDANAWDPADVSTVAEGTVSGVERFNVTVFGDKTKSSSLSNMRSTGNNLREVNIVSAEGGTADLTIGNTNTLDYVGAKTRDILGLNKANALKDVQTLNADGFNGDLNVDAALTGEVTEKYLKDGATKIDFVYTGGKGNDTFDVAIDSGNLANSGTATHSAFNFAINSGEGNDEVIVGIYDAVPGTALAAAGATTPWYMNQKTNSNLDINAGSGDDIVRIQGSGDWTVNLSTGDDVIYVDNAGDITKNVQKASWIFNASNNLNAALVGSVNGSFTVDYTANGWTNAVGDGNTTHKLYKAGITLTFNDDNAGTSFELNLTVDPDLANGYQTSQRAINEAIKDAIANDNVFSKLVEASTGQMADSLIINSLIDGSGTGLSIAVNQLAGGSTQAQIDLFNAQYGSNITIAGLANANNILVNTGGIPDATSANSALNGPTNIAEVKGTDGVTVGEQIITGGKGDDVFVLGTSANQKHTLVYEGKDNGYDTILNFDGGSAGVDKIDLSSYGIVAANVQLAATKTSVLTGAGITVGGATDKVIVFVENINNPAVDAYKDNIGEFSVEIWQKAVGGNTLVETIGILDFGQNIPLDITNFVL